MVIWCRTLHLLLYSFLIKRHVKRRLYPLSQFSSSPCLPMPPIPRLHPQLTPGGRPSAPAPASHRRPGRSCSGGAATGGRSAGPACSSDARCLSRRSALRSCTHGRVPRAPGAARVWAPAPSAPCGVGLPPFAGRSRSGGAAGEGRSKSRSQARAGRPRRPSRRRRGSAWPPAAGR